MVGYMRLASSLGLRNHVCTGHQCQRTRCRLCSRLDTLDRFEFFKTVGSGERGARCSSIAHRHQHWSATEPLFLTGCYSAQKICRGGRADSCFNPGSLARSQRLWDPMDTAASGGYVQACSCLICSFTPSAHMCHGNCEGSTTAGP